MKRNYIFMACWSDIYNKYNFINVLCAGQESSIVDFVDCQLKTYVRVKIE